MNTAKHFDKWIEGLASESTVADAARNSLQHRVQAVLEYLPLAAKHSNENVEYVHLLRVWTRRSMAAINLYKKVLPKRPLRRLRRKLERIRHVAGEARDLDVLIEQLMPQESEESKALADRVRRRRKKAQQPIHRCFHRMHKRKRLEKLLKTLLQSVSVNADSVQPFTNWTKAAMASVVDRFNQAYPNDQNDLQAMHRFRIRVKNLRYAMELLAPALPAELKDSVYPRIEELQELLGGINDRAVALSRLSKWLSKCPRKIDRSELRKKLSQEREQLIEAQKCFYGWWTLDVQSQIRDSLIRLTITNPSSVLELQSIEST